MTDDFLADLREEHGYIGYHVVVNRVGTAPLDQCTIRALRPGPKVLAHRLGSSRLHNDVITTVTNNTVYVDVAR